MLIGLIRPSHGVTRRISQDKRGNQYHYIATYIFYIFMATANNQGSRHGSSKCLSPIGQVDPMVRALNTIMYGLVIHFGSWWLLGTSSTDSSNHTPPPPVAASACEANAHPSWYWLRSTLLLHEYWVYLQHTNVLANPYCQRLDRQYGIALLKSNQHWAIAGTLSAYWCRESIGMFLCLPFLSSQEAWMTRYLILYSLIYHTIKSRGVRQDALRRYSPTHGIMRVVIDKFYLDTTSETIVSIVRLFLQGLDTWIHHCIIRDMLDSWPTTHPWEDSNASSSIVVLLHSLFGIWVLHAALNQYFRCSTASLMVQAWYAITQQQQTQAPTPTHQQRETSSEIITSHPVVNKKAKNNHEEQNDDNHDSDDEDTATECSMSTTDSEDSSNLDTQHQEYIVRDLLRPGRVPGELRGRQGAATDGVDTAVRIETALAILASLFILGMANVPFRALASDFTFDEITSVQSPLLILGWETTTMTYLSFTWLLASLLYGIWSLFLRGTNPSLLPKCVESESVRAQRRAVVNIVDLVVVIVTATYVIPESGMICYLLAAGVTAKSYLQAARIPRPPLFWMGMKVGEFLGKLLLVRQIGAKSLTDGNLAVLEFVTSLVWASWVVWTPVLTPCECASQRIGESNDDDKHVADVVFLGHPAELVDCWALWLLPYSLKNRWQSPLWALPLWPVHYIVGWYVCNVRRRIFGDKASFFCCDDVNYDGIQMQTWTAAHFGRHFVTHPSQVKENIEAAARHAEISGVKVLCLGALNKAESINGGGVGVVKALGSESRLSVVHGNHLTAAAVVETTVQVFGEKAKVFLTGASSKVGWAVAVALRDRHGYEVLCHSTDHDRRLYFQEQGFAAASNLSDGMMFSKYWIVGKYDRAVAKMIPQNGTAVVFSVPHPLGERPDVRVVEAGTLHMDLDRLDRPRRFTNKLKEHEVFACHAASVVAAYRLKRDGLKRLEEVGPVDPKTMDEWLTDAKQLGFQVPRVVPQVAYTKTLEEGALPVVIIGAGPSGLAVAALLTCRNIPTIILEANHDSTQFGSWDQHFTGLEITSQKKWCNLPGFSMLNNEGFPHENITSADYRRYLRLYVSRFGLDVRHGIRVDSIEKNSDAKRPWTIHCTTQQAKDDGISGTSQTFSAFAVVVATGKHRIPNRDTSDHLCEKLSKANIPFLHSTDLCDDSTWAQVIDVATRGTLAMVGFGNSAADIATIILRQCPDTAKIHIAARTVPPVFPRKASVLRVDTLGYYFVRWLPVLLQEMAVRLLWLAIPSSRRCNAAFPAHLQRWSKVAGRVPVIDKYGAIVSGFASGRLVGHGPVLNVGPKVLVFDDMAHVKNDKPVSIEMVIMATGYRQDSLVGREDRLNGLYRCGFGKEKFLPLQSIGEEAAVIAKAIAKDYKS